MIEYAIAAVMTMSRRTNRALRLARFSDGEVGMREEKVSHIGGSGGRCARRYCPRKINHRSSALNPMMATAMTQETTEVSREFANSPILARLPVN